VFVNNIIGLCWSVVRAYGFIIAAFILGRRDGSRERGLESSSSRHNEQKSCFLYFGKISGFFTFYVTNHGRLQGYLLQQSRHQVVAKSSESSQSRRSRCIIIYDAHI
jgi:hypothetical protein